MKKIIALSIIGMALTGCATNSYRWSGVNNNGTGYNNISYNQAYAECEYSSQRTLNNQLQYTGSPIMAGYYGAIERDNCMKSKGFYKQRVENK